MSLLVPFLNGLLAFLALILGYSLFQFLREALFEHILPVFLALGFLMYVYKYIPRVAQGFWKLMPIGALIYLIIGFYFGVVVLVCCLFPYPTQNTEKFSERYGEILAFIGGLFWLPILTIWGVLFMFYLLSATLFYQEPRPA